MAAEPLAQAAEQRHRRALDRAEHALCELQREGASITFQHVASRAGVSRQWLYTQPALRTQIQTLRDHHPARADGVPARERASEASLLQRLASLREENQRLRQENQTLKTELAMPTVDNATPTAAEESPSTPVHPPLRSGAQGCRRARTADPRRPRVADAERPARPQLFQG